MIYVYDFLLIHTTVLNAFHGVTIYVNAKINQNGSYVQVGPT